MKKSIIIILLLSLVFSCNKSNQKENELIKKENELLKRELKIQKKESEILTKKITDIKPIPDEVKIQLSNLMSSYTRQMDLVPNLVNTVKNNTGNENSLLKDLIKSRSTFIKSISSTKLLDEKNMSIFESKENRFSIMFNRVILLSQKYPKLQNNKNYLEIITQLEGTKNRIMVEKVRFNSILDKHNLNYPKFNLHSKSVQVEF